jgi:alpha-L-arabinofuranosidase
VRAGFGRHASEEFLPGWKQYFARLRPQQTDFKAQLRIQVQGPGALDLDMVSLFPRDTWKGRRGGLRADLVEMLAAMKPGFLRFPGGCIVEGRYLTNRYDWKTTLGAPETRKLIINRWNNEFRHRPAPDYYQSFGLGFFEYFQLCEDLGAEPMPILNCGMACQFNSGELAPLQELDSYIQGTLDLIEFANGPASTRWARTRGHGPSGALWHETAGHRQ